MLQLPQGKYYCANTVTNLPVNVYSYVEIREIPGGVKFIVAYPINSVPYTNYYSGRWYGWNAPVSNSDLASKNQKITSATSPFEIAGSPYIWCMKSGNMVSCIGKLKAISAITTRTVAFTIPVGFRPSDYIAIDLLSRQGYVNVDITPSTGEVTVYPNIQSGDIVNINITWTVK